MGRMDYCPSREEIAYRKEAMNWMSLMEWPDHVIESIMLYDNPDLETVRHLVYRHGVDKAVELISRFADERPNAY